MAAENQMEAKASRSHHYTPLRDPSSQIRFLEVDCETSGPDDLIKCRLATWDVETAPPYHAISYTWGPEELTETILLDDGPAVVRKNCADVLRQLLYFKSCLYYWLDALCIDQTNVIEKNAQVAMMGSFFSKAEHVLVCIGQEDDDGEYALQAIRDQRRYGGSPPSGERSDTDHRPVIVKKDPNGKIPPDVNLPRFTLSLAALSRRPYFERVWVVQEIYLAREASVCCGKIKLPIAHLERELHNANSILQRLITANWLVRGDSQGFVKKLEGVPMELLNALRPIEWTLNEKCGWMLENTVEPSKRSTGVSFNWLVENFSTLRCQDPRDKVYGALALVDWQDTPPILPDYSRSAFSLALEMSGMHVDEHKIPQLLKNLKIGNEDADVRRGIAWRQQNRAACLESQIPGPHSPSFEKKIRQIREGWQLATHECLWRRGRDSEDARLIYCGQGELIVPHETRAGDWIIYQSRKTEAGETVHKPRRDCFVLREVDRRYAFIGRAIEVESGASRTEHELESSMAWFTLEFDHEDFLVLAATEGQLPLTEVVETGVCSEPFSSYGEVQDRTTLSYPSSPNLEDGDSQEHAALSFPMYPSSSDSELEWST